MQPRNPVIPRKQFNDLALFVAFDDGGKGSGQISLRSVGMRCPCGCGDRIELIILKEARPRWDVSVNKAGEPSLRPSVWRKSGCRSHFWVREGRILWCE